MTLTEMTRARAEASSRTPSTPQPPDEPRTRAGRQLVADLMSPARRMGPWQVADGVNAIEAEARADLRARIEALRPEDYITEEPTGLYRDGFIAGRAAVLALLPGDTAPTCGVEVNLTEAAYGNLYEPCAKPKGHTGHHDPSQPVQTPEAE